MSPEDLERLRAIRERAQFRDLRRKVAQPPKTDSKRPRAVPSAQDDTLALLDLVDRLLGPKAR